MAPASSVGRPCLALLTVASLALPGLSIGCVAYERQVDIAVHDPGCVWLETASTHERIEPSKIDQEAAVPVAHTTVERASSGALAVSGRTVVGRGGSLSWAPTSLDRVEVDGDRVRVPICSRRHGCENGVRLATTMGNIRLLRERDVPIWFIGIQELLLAGGAFVGSRLTWQPTTSGGPILLTAGIGLSILGVAQIFAPARNERSLVPGVSDPE